MATTTASGSISPGTAPDGLVDFWGTAISSMNRIHSALTPEERWARWNAAASVRPQPQWLQPTILRMLDLPWDDYNWNDDAKPTDPDAAFKLLALLASILDDDAPPPYIVPTWCGGVQAEWHTNGVDLEIEIDPTATDEYYFVSSTAEYEEPIAGNLEKLTMLTSFLSPDKSAVLDDQPS